MKGGGKKQATALKKRDNWGAERLQSSSSGVVRIYALPEKGDGAMPLLGLQRGGTHHSHGRVYLKRIGNALEVDYPLGHEGEQTQAQ